MQLKQHNQKGDNSKENSVIIAATRYAVRSAVDSTQYTKACKLSAF